MLKMFSVYDKKAQFYSNPFVARTVGEGVRSFEQAVNDPQTQIYKYPQDYELWLLAEFDEQTGNVVKIDNQISFQAVDYEKPTTVK